MHKKASLDYIIRPPVDWTEDADIYKKLDWKETVQFIMGRPLNSEQKSVKATYLMCWLDQKARNYVTSNDTSLKDHTKVLDTLETWCKPKCNKIAAFMQLRTLKQDSLSLSEFINNTTKLVGDCNYPDNARGRLLRDIVVSAVALPEAYRKFTAATSYLTLKDTIKIYKSEDLIRR